MPEVVPDFFFGPRALYRARKDRELPGPSISPASRYLAPVSLDPVLPVSGVDPGRVSYLAFGIPCRSCEPVAGPAFPYLAWCRALWPRCPVLPPFGYLPFSLFAPYA